MEGLTAREHVTTADSSLHALGFRHFGGGLPPPRGEVVALQPPPPEQVLSTLEAQTDVDAVVEAVPAVPAGLAAPVATRLIPRPQPKIKAHIKDILTMAPW